MNLVDLSIRRPVMMTMVILAFVVLGLFSLTRLGIDIFPDVEFPFVVATIIYPGAGPEEMETQVAEPVEEVVSAIGGIKTVRSISEEGITLVMMEFDLDMDVDIAAIDVRDKVDQIRQNLPEDILDPVIAKFDFASLPIINLAASSPRSLEEIYHIADNTIKPGLSRVKGLADIRLTGGLEREIQVNLSRAKLRSYELSPQIVGAFISAYNANIPAGHIIEGKKEIGIRLEGEFTDLDQIRAIKIPHGENGSVRIDQLGWVEDTYKEVRDRARFNGEASVGLELLKRADANTVEVSREVFKEVEKIRKQLPPDVKLDVARNLSQFIQNSVDDVFGNIIIGVLLTTLVLYMFLFNIPSTVVAAVSMPTSIISTFILLDFAGFTLNMMSLMALAISVGILVANSIVVLENIQRYRDMGMPILEAASKGTREIGVAVAAATLTNIVVFTPMAFMSGISGQFFRQFGLTVAFATLFSLLVSFTLTPMMASRHLRSGLYIVLGVVATFVIYWRLGTTMALFFVFGMCVAGLGYAYGVETKLMAGWNRFYDGIKASYTSSLSMAMRHKFKVLILVTLLFIGAFALVPLGFIGSEFFPKADQGAFTANIEMPVGSNLEETDRIINEVARRVMERPYVKSVYTATGKTEMSFSGTGQGSNLGVVVAQMLDADLRPITTAQFLDELRPNLTDLPDAKIFLKETSVFGGGGESDLQVELTGSEMDVLTALSDSLILIMNEVGGLVNIESSWSLGKPEFRMRPLIERIQDYGTTTGELGMTLRNLVEGDLVSKFREGGEEYDIRVQMDDWELRQASDVGDIYMMVGGKPVLVRSLTEGTYVEGPTSIYHKNKVRMVAVTADVAVGTMGQKIAAIRERLDGIKLPAGYGYFFGGEAEHMAESFAELFKAMFLAIILTYMLLAAIMESYKHPFTIMLSLPLGLIGVLLSLFLTGNSISLFSLMAMVMLVGIVVNNGILLIDYIGQLRREGRGVDEAVLEACPIRLRPILMTNLATSLGMLPLALGFGSGGEFRAPMAITSIGGLLSSMVFTLYVIPIIYRLMEGRAAAKV